MDSTDKPWQFELGFKVASRLENLFQVERYTDCVFKVGRETTEKFEAHRVLLATSSPVFEAMFYGKLANNENPIEILDIQPNIFKLMLRYIYSDKFDITSSTEVYELFNAANKYMLLNLLEECTEYIMDELKPENVCRTLEFAKLYENKQILDACHKVIKEKTQEVFKVPNFLEADISTLEEILAKESLSVPGEIDVWRACVLWSRSNCKEEDVNAENQRHALQKLLPLIRFLTMTPKEFAEGPEKTNILTVTESHKILLSLVSHETSSMPSNLCTNTNSRCRISVEILTPINHRIQSPDIRRQLPCKIGNYVNDCNSDKGYSRLYFSCSSAIMLKGVRLVNIPNFRQDLYDFGISDEIRTICFTTTSYGCKVSEFQDHMFGDDVEIKPNRQYIIFWKIWEKCDFPIYDIITPVKINNVTVTFSKKDSYCLHDYMSNRGFTYNREKKIGVCPFVQLLFCE